VTLLASPRTAVLPRAEWQALEAAHQAHADALTQGWRDRQLRHEKHPVDDFLFTYYPLRPGLLRRWHPGGGIALEGAASLERAGWKWYTSEGAHSRVDVDGFAQAKAASIRFITSLLERTAARPANFGCFGLHEWAMAYRTDEPRHDIPLRLGRPGTDEVVESNRIGCSHFDAFRFFTADAVPMNRLLPTRENQPELEQPGCLHAGMDVYKWAIKLGPLVPGDLLLDTFELSRDIRQLDMRASPYELRDWGYEPVRIETAEGKAHYVREQRVFSERSNALRGRLVSAVRSAIGPEFN
jgi:hypothetical protein